jgi:hypothetical protein
VRPVAPRAIPRISATIFLKTVEVGSEPVAETSEPEGNVVDTEFTEDNATPQAAAAGADEEPPL